jgi:hypothetical protein
MLDESIARGLKNTLWRAAVKECERIDKVARVNKEHPIEVVVTSRKQLLRGMDLLQKRFATPLMLIYNRREGRRPLWWFIMLTVNEKVAVNEWQERVFEFRFVGQRFVPPLDCFVGLSMRICEHAVTRLYQRAPQENELPSQDSIYPELACAATNGLWHFLAIRNSIEFCTAFVPTETGAFLGQVSNDRQFLDLRTYIAKDQMRPEQLRLWDELKALTIYERTLKIFPEFMLEIGANSSRGAKELVLLVQKVIDGYPRLLGRRPQKDGGTSV